MPRKQSTYDNLLLLKDAGAVTADGVATVAGTPRVLDLGPADIGQAKAVIDTSAIDLTDADETYRVRIEGSTDLAFTTPVELASQTVTGSGRTELPFSNTQNDVVYQYIRAAFDVGGTTPSLNATIYVAKD